MGTKTAIMTVAIALAVAGCTRSSDALRVNTQAPPQPLPSTPSGNVQSAQLDQLQPLDSQDPLAQPANPQVPQAPTVLDTPTAPQTQNLETASIDPANAKPITHDAMAGSWNVATDSPSCRLVMSFTKWSGGYRAATLRCNSTELASVSAWDVKSNQVVLVDTNGNQVASLGSAGNERYAGALAGGQPITLSR